MYFSPSTSGFYNVRPDHVESVAVTRAKYLELLDGVASGLVIGIGADGGPVLVGPAGPSMQQLSAARRIEIISELMAIDTASARPLRAILVGSATAEDRARLAELDEQAAALRLELAALEAPEEPEAPPAEA